MTLQQILGGVAAAAAAMAAVCHAATFGGDPGEGIKYAGFALDLIAAGTGAFTVAISGPVRMGLQLMQHHAPELTEARLKLRGGEE